MATTILGVNPTGPLAVSIEEAKLYCRIENDLEDGLLQTLINAATTQAEHFTGRTLVQTEYLLSIGVDEPVDHLGMPLTPCTAVKSVVIDGTAIEVGECGFIPSVSIGRPLFAQLTLPIQAKERVDVEIVVGFDPVPDAFKQWILTKVATLYEHRESVTIGQNFNTFGRSFVDALIEPYSIYGRF